MNYHQTKIKRATKDYFCEKCHNIIKSGTDYVDCAQKITDAEGKIMWVHDRYHADCNSVVLQGENTLDKVFTKLKTEGPFTMGNKGDKVLVQGIIFDHNDKPFIVCRTWEERTVYYETVENFKTYVDWKGDTL